MSPKDIVAYLVITFGATNIDWPFQMKLAKKLLNKYTGTEIKYALDYYKAKGEDIYSLGYLSTGSRMKDPVSLYHAELNIQEGGDSGERNRERIRQNSQTEYRAEPVGYLFAESREDN